MPFYSLTGETMTKELANATNQIDLIMNQEIKKVQQKSKKNPMQGLMTYLQEMMKTQ